jgi:hypothetical protein
MKHCANRLAPYRWCVAAGEYHLPILTSTKQNPGRTQSYLSHFERWLKIRAWNRNSAFSLQVDRYHEDMRRRLNARCKGLLDVVHESPSLPRYFQYNVQYLHRTVRDFLFETSEMQNFLESLLPEGYRAQNELCKAFVRLLTAIPMCTCGCDAKMTSQSRMRSPSIHAEAIDGPGSLDDDYATQSKHGNSEPPKGNGHIPSMKCFLIS